MQHRQDVAIEHVAVPLRPASLSALLDTLAVFRLGRESHTDRLRTRCDGSAEAGHFDTRGSVELWCRLVPFVPSELGLGEAL